MAGIQRFPIVLSPSKQFAIDIGTSAPHSYEFVLYPSRKVPLVITPQAGEAHTQSFNIVIADRSTMKFVVTSYPYAMPVSLDGGFAIGIIETKDIVELRRMLTGQEAGFGIDVAAEELAKCISIMAGDAVGIGADSTDVSMQKYTDGDMSSVGLDSVIAAAYYLKPIYADGSVGSSCELGTYELGKSLGDVLAELAVSMRLEGDVEIEKRMFAENELLVGVTNVDFISTKTIYAEVNGVAFDMEAEVGGYRWRLLRDLDELTLADLDNLTLGEIDMYLI